MSVVTFEATLQESVETFDATKRQTYKQGLAAALSGVNAEDIELLVESASIRVTAEITTADATIATSAQTTLGDVSAAELGTMTGTTVLTVSPPQVRVQLGQSVSPTSTIFGDDMLMIIGGSCAVGAVLLLGATLVLRINRHKKRPSRPGNKIGVSTTSTSSTASSSSVEMGESPQKKVALPVNPDFVKVKRTQNLQMELDLISDLVNAEKAAADAAKEDEDEDDESECRDELAAEEADLAGGATPGGELDVTMAGAQQQTFCAAAQATYAPGKISIPAPSASPTPAESFRNFFEKTFGGIGQGTGSIEKTFCAAAQSTYVSGASCAPSALTDTFDNKDAVRSPREQSARDRFRKTSMANKKQVDV